MRVFRCGGDDFVGQLFLDLKKETNLKICTTRKSKTPLLKNGKWGFLLTMLPPPDCKDGKA